MGLLQNTSPTQDQGWNLADEINMDWSSGALFDDLPSKAKALRANETIESLGEGRKFNTSAEGSFVPGSAIAPIETPKSRANADSILRESAQLSGNPLDNFQAPSVRTEEPKGSSETIGGIISRGFGYIEKLKDMKGARFGQKREVGVMKGMDEAAIARTYNIMQDHLRRNGYDDPNLLEALAKHRGGGYRSAENINQLFEIKAKGTKFQDENGEVIVAPDSDWETIFEADRISRAMSLKSQKTAGGDPMKAVSDAQAALKPIIDESGNPLPGKEAQFERLNGIIDSALQLPTGVYAYSDQYSRLSDRENKLKLAYANGINFGGVAKDNIPQEIVNLNEQKVALAVERAPTFNMSEPNDKVKMQDWLAKGETKNLLFNAILDDGSIATFEPTTQENIYRRWSPTEKQWKIANFNKPQDNPVSEKPETNSEFSKAGQAGQKIRRAASKIAGAAESGVAKAGAAVADLLPLSVNTGASVIEGAAGVFDTPLKLDRMDYLEERAKKNKVGKYRDK